MVRRGDRQKGLKRERQRRAEKLENGQVAGKGFGGFENGHV